MTGLLMILGSLGALALAMGVGYCPGGVDGGSCSPPSSLSDRAWVAATAAKGERHPYEVRSSLAPRNPAARHAELHWIPAAAAATNYQPCRGRGSTIVTDSDIALGAKFIAAVSVWYVSLSGPRNNQYSQ